MRFASYRIIMFLIGLALALPVIAPAQSPGKKETVGFSPESPRITFVYCPPGKHLAGDPTKNEITEIKKGFWIARDELTQDAFFDLLARLSPEEKEMWKQRGARLDKSAYTDVMVKKAGEVDLQLATSAVIGPDYPIFCLGLHEAVLVCAALNAREERGGPVIRTYRLPTDEEWEYAARARTVVENPVSDDSAAGFDLAAQNFPYFNAWPRWSDVPVARRNKIADIWKTHGPAPATPFTGGQQQMIDLLRFVKDKDVKEELWTRLSQMLEQATGLKHDFREVDRSRLQKAEAGLSNRWGIRHMHGNVAEWVLPTEGWPKNWQALLDGGEAAKETKAQVRGGQFRHGGRYVLDEAPWEAFTIGHRGKEKSFDQTTRTDYPAYFAGLRLVMMREADPVTWLARLRKQAGTEALPDAEGQTKWLALLDNAVRQLEEVDAAEAKKARKQLRYIRSQYLTRGGNRAAAADALKGGAEEEEDDTVYLAGLKRVLKADLGKK